jgi:hypothetical protein
MTFFCWVQDRRFKALGPWRNSQDFLDMFISKVIITSLATEITIPTIIVTINSNLTCS